MPAIEQLIELAAEFDGKHTGDEVDDLGRTVHCFDFWCSPLPRIGSPDAGAFFDRARLDWSAVEGDTLGGVVWLWERD